MGHISPAIRALGRRRAPPPPPLLLPLLLLLLRAQLAVGSLAGGSPGAAEVRTGGWGKGRTRPRPDADVSRAESAAFPARWPAPGSPNGTRHSRTQEPRPQLPILCRPSHLPPPA